MAKLYSKKDYEAAGSPADLVIPEGFTEIGPKTFINATSSLKSVVFPSTMTELPDELFRNCTALESISFSNLLKSIGKFACDGCISLRHINIHAEELKYCAFMGCTSLQKVVLQDGLRQIGAYAFKGCTALSSINIPSSVTEIEGGAFHKTNLANCTLASDRFAISDGLFLDKETETLISPLDGSVSSVAVPAGITKIKTNAFSDQKNLKEISLPNGLLEIGISAFSRCENLESVEIPDSVVEIGRNAFEACKALKSAALGCGLQKIADDTFKGCSSLESIDIPDSVVEIGRSAFRWCDALKSIAFGSGLQKIKNDAFSVCESIESVIIPDSVTEIQDSAFDYCKSLKTLVLGGNLKKVGTSAFAECNALEHVTIKNPETKLGLMAFKNCISVTEVNLPKGLTWGKIKAKFKDSPWGQTNPTPKKAQQTEKTAAKKAKLEAFNAMALDASLSEWKHSIEMDGGMAVVRVDFANGHTILGRYQLKGKFDIQSFVDVCRKEATSTDVPTLRITAWKKSIQDIGVDCSAFLKLILSPDIETIDDNAFVNKSFTEVVLPESLTTIGFSAFCGCDKLLFINLPASLTTIGALAFCECKALTSLNLHDGITSIEWNAFVNSGLKDADIESKHYAIKNGLFIDKDSKVLLRVLKSGENLNIPAGIEKIRDNAFSRSYGEPASMRVFSDFEIEDETKFLIRLTIQSGLKIIGSKAFADCVNLQEVEFPDTVIEIGSGAFKECKNLQTVNLPSLLTTLGKEAFFRCNSLNSVDIPGSVSEIKDDTFNQCTSLKDVILHDGLTKIGHAAFLKCTSLESITIPDSVTEIATGDRINKFIFFPGAFEDCTELKQVTLPDDLMFESGSFKNAPWRKTAAAKRHFIKKK